MRLSSSVLGLSLVGGVYQKRLLKLGIETVDDLLHHVPFRYLDFSQTSPIARARPDDLITVKGKVTFIKNQYTRFGRKIQIAQIEDNTGKITAVWFNQPYLIRTLYPGSEVSLAGRVGWFGRQKTFVSPEFEKVVKGKKSVHTGRIIPVYHETSGVSSKWIRGRVKEAFDNSKKELKEYLPQATLADLTLTNLAQAVGDVHFPNTLQDSQEGRRRMSFDELLFLQIKNVHRKITWQKYNVSHKLGVDKDQIDEFVKSLPFVLTSSQTRSVDEILSDISKAYPMNRLLEGDVGSGKTVVAAIAAFVAFSNGNQAVIMAPTQILARQHYLTLSKLFEKYKLRLSLLTSDVTKKGIGRSDIFVGTHALIKRKVDFDNVALVVIDEQHRFGVEQRAELIKKTRGKIYSPHVLTMTATPIPRTVALTFYGDLDLSTLDELPQGRIKITTWIVPPAKRPGAYAWIKEKLTKEHVQAFVICPLIEESEIETLKSVAAVKAQYQQIKKEFKSFKVGLLHGKLKAADKEKEIAGFTSGKIDILVSTPVVEVGIDVPNATIMVIEGAERFGLSQLHQLRGRVGRGKIKSYCLIVTDVKSKNVTARLNALTQDLSGFELSELDLKLRGPGEIFGTRQSGYWELKIASWSDIELIKQSKAVAIDVFENPSKFPKLWEKLEISLA